MHEESGATRTRMAPPCFLSPNTCHLTPVTCSTVEAGRFELPSCMRSSAASTRVSRRLISPDAGRQASDVRMSLLKSRPRAADAPLGQPGFALPEHRPGRAATQALLR